MPFSLPLRSFNSFFYYRSKNSLSAIFMQPEHANIALYPIWKELWPIIIIPTWSAVIFLCVFFSISRRIIEKYGNSIETAIRQPTNICFYHFRVSSSTLIFIFSSLLCFYYFALLWLLFLFPFSFPSIFRFLLRSSVVKSIPSCLAGLWYSLSFTGSGDTLFSTLVGVGWSKISINVFGPKYYTD